MAGFVARFFSRVGDPCRVVVPVGEREKEQGQCRLLHGMGYRGVVFPGPRLAVVSPQRWAFPSQLCRPFSDRWIAERKNSFDWLAPLASGALMHRLPPSCSVCWNEHSWGDGNKHPAGRHRPISPLLGALGTAGCKMNSLPD